MNKHFFSLSALVLALLLSAFSKPAPRNAAAGAQLVWYVVDENNQIDPSFPMNAEEPMTADQFRDYFYPICTPGTDVDCARGFHATTLPGGGSESGVEQIRKDL